MRRFSKGIFILALLVVLFATGKEVGIAHACSCISSAERTTDEAYQSSDAVFSGKVLSINWTRELPVTFNVSRVWKGPDSASISLWTSQSSASCGNRFETGEEYLVYAISFGGRLETNSCLRTKALYAAEEDVLTLNEITGGRALQLPSMVITALAFVLVLLAYSLLFLRRRVNAHPAIEQHRKIISNRTSLPEMKMPRSAEPFQSKKMRDSP